MVARVSPVWSLPAAVVLPLVGIVLALLGLFAISEWSLRQLERNSSRFESAVEVSKLIEQWRAAVLDAESGQLGYLLTRDTAYLQPLTSAAERLPAVMQALQERAQGDAQLSALVADLSVPARLKFDNLAHTLRAMRAGDYERALDLVRSGEGQHSIGEMRRRFARLEAYAAERAELAQAARHQSNMIARIALLLATLVVAGLVFKLLQLFAADAARREQGRLADKLRRDELEREVDARTRELSSLSSHLQSVAESEKSELARELHDQMGGLLTAAKMDLAWLRERPQINDDHEYKQKLVGLGTVLDQAMGVKRRVVESLRPSLLEHFGLSVALQAYFEDECRKAGLECV
ncbi:MAG: CHASE3 domain-containing protein, partial [Pseudomonadales bacterium]|nr:CHASE3 domain-containing protein [Pseudomonadales bacterium]